MTVSCRLFVNRALQVEHFDDAGRPEVEVFADQFDDLFVFDFARAEGFYVDRNGMGYANGVSQLDFAFISQACGYNVLCHIAGCVSC